jgi:hypothetical protein
VVTHFFATINALIFAIIQAEIDQQRRFLKPSQIEEFDATWGMDPTGMLLLFPLSWCIASIHVVTSHI